MFFVQYHENEILGFDETSYIEVFHFVDRIVFSGLFNKQHLYLLLYYPIKHTRLHSMFVYCAVVGYYAVFVVLITRTYLYNVDLLEPHFYIVKLGFKGVYIIFLFLLKNIDCGYLLELPRQGNSNEYPQSVFGAEI